MKISSNFPIKYIQQKYNTNKLLQQKNSVELHSEKKEIPNSSLYQAYNNIPFAGTSILEGLPSVDYISCLRETRRREDEIVFSYTDSQGRRQKGIIPSRTVTNLLKDDNDEVEKKWLDIYVGLYTLKRNELMEGETATSSFLQEQAEKIKENNAKKIQGFKTAQQLKSDSLILQKAQNQTINHDDIDLKATLFATVAITLLRGGGCQENLHFSDKLILAKKLSTFNENFNNARATEMIINESKTPEGKVDIEFCSKLTDLLLNNGLLPRGEENEFIGYVSDTLKMVLNSADDKDLAFECALDLLSEGFFINPYYKVFESIFDLCLNPIDKKFNVVAFERLLAASECYDQNITSQTDFETVQEVDDNEKERKMFIFSYMSTVVDIETGKIKEDAMSPDEFYDKYFE